MKELSYPAGKIPDTIKRMRTKKITAMNYTTEFITPKSKLKMIELQEKMEEEFQKAVSKLKEDLIKDFMERDKNAPEDLVRHVVETLIRFECIQEYDIKSQNYSLRIVPRWKTAEEILEMME